MPIQVSWYDKAQTIIHYQFKGHWNWDEFHRITSTGLEMMATKTHTVHFIADFSENRQWMTGMLSHVQALLENPLPNTGAIVVIEANYFMRLLYGVLKQVEHRFPFKMEVHFVDTLHDASRVLSEQV